jgi:hypothetical protein
MADNLFFAQSAEVALMAGVPKTVLQVAAPANQKVKVLEWGVFFDGTVVTAEPCEIVLVRQSTAGTMTPVTPAKVDESDSQAIQSTVAANASAEPALGEIVDMVEVHPQQGYAKIYPLGQERVVTGGGRIAIQIKAPANVNVRPYMTCEE